MDRTKSITSLFFFFFFFLSLSPSSTTGLVAKHQPLYQHSLSTSLTSKTQLYEQGFNEGELLRWRSREPRRLMIGSTAPTCTFNECRGCKFRCIAQQIPVDANDPINSAYHYKCVCRR